MTDQWQDEASRAREILKAPLDDARRGEFLAAAVGLLDLTSLNATDTLADVLHLCQLARKHEVAAACVWSSFAKACAEELAGSAVRPCVVAGAFPHGQAPLEVKVAEVGAAAEAGAREIDVVIHRGLLLRGRMDAMAAEIGAMRAQASKAPAPVTLKVILETCEIPAPALLREATGAVIAELHDGDFIKTSTGKGATGATPERAVVMLEAIAAAAAAGKIIGFKAAGGLRTAEDATTYMRLAEAICGRAWLAPARLRLGASTLLEELLRG